MSTSSRPTSTRRFRRVSAAAAFVVALAGLGAASLTRSDASDVPTTTAVRGLPASADAADAWLTAQANEPEPSCPPYAALRWQVPQIAVADLPHTPDASEAWLTPEINVADLPYTADAMERWICAP